MIKIRSLLLGIGLGVGLPGVGRAAPLPANHDETKVPAYELPDPLRGPRSAPITTPEAWRARRGELLDLFAAEMYGRAPIGRPAAMHWETTETTTEALGGRAVRRQITLWLGEGKPGPAIHLLLYLPKRPEPAPRGGWPVFLGLNFFGNHTVHPDPGIALAEPFTFYDVARYRPGTPPPGPLPEQRGADASKWPIELILERGYGFATIYRGDACPDDPAGLSAAAAAFFHTGGVEERAPDAWGAVAIWAWTLSRAQDVLAQEPDVDASRVVVHGFSRLGKAAVWAAAQDERFAGLVSFQSGCGGAALSKRFFGETVAIINKNFPHWFARNFRRYDDTETSLPFDQHELLALVAPRPVLVGSAAEDHWSDPRGEFLSAKSALPVWGLFGPVEPVGDEPPRVGGASGGRVRYFIRPGKHDVVAEDWTRALEFADAQVRGR